MTDTTKNSTSSLPLLEIGLIVAGRMSNRERLVIHRVQSQLQSTMRNHFDDYDWCVEQSVRRDIGEFRRVESSRLLQEAADEKNSHHWDYVILFTADDLITHYRSSAMAALSRPLDAAVLSTARLIPDDDGPTADEPVTSEQVIEARLVALSLRIIAHFAGLKTQPDKTHFLGKPESPRDLDDVGEITDEDKAEMSRAFKSIADTRLEEKTDRSMSRRRFFINAAWINRDEIGEAVVAAKPWEFPYRLSRLTTAAVSTVAVLLLSAESWDLGLSLTGRTTIVMAILLLVATTAFVVTKQKLLLVRRRQKREQIAATQVTAVLIVFLGMTTTWAVMFVLAVTSGTLLFNDTLIQSWASSSHLGDDGLGISAYSKMSAYCASIGLLIGALGASFEDQNHFQHVIFVDMEL